MSEHKHTDEQILTKAREYLEHETDDRFRGEVERLIDDRENDKSSAELADRFYTDLEFGTGGLRGVIGGGSNRMNPLVLGRATEGLARYCVRAGSSTSGELRAVIAHDSRRYSEEFALSTALVFAAHGVKAYLFPSLRPTPVLSFAVRELGATTGVVVTASHNPPEYNGYKVYWSDGAQIVEPHDRAIIDEVRAVTGAPKRLTKEEALDRGLLEYLDDRIDDAFVAMVKRQSVRPQLLKERGSSLTVVYTPLHGTGAMMVERVLQELGATVVTVPEQREPDGEFPTVKFPNPEEADAMELAVRLGRERQADIVMGTDPDADRLGIAVPVDTEYRLITGNQLGALLADYMLGGLRETGRMPANPVFVKTIVTTELQRKIAEHHGARVVDTLTGFKHIATVMRELDEHPDRGTYVLGGEESYGYLIGTEVRDKDAITAAVLTAEMALYHVSQHKGVLDRLRELWMEFGYHEEIQISRYFKGSSGVDVMASMMKRLREQPPREIGGVAVREIRDYKSGRAVDASGGGERPIDLPSSNVLQYILDDDTVVSARPSGTEPKIKFYASVCQAPGMDVEPAIEASGLQLSRIESWVEQQIASVTDAS